MFQTHVARFLSNRKRSRPSCRRVACHRDSTSIYSTEWQNMNTMNDRLIAHQQNPTSFNASSVAFFVRGQCHHVLKPLPPQTTNFTPLVSIHLDDPMLQICPKWQQFKAGARVCQHQSYWTMTMAPVFVKLCRACAMPRDESLWIVENPQRGHGKIQGVDKTHEHDGRKNVEFGWIWWSKETSGGCSKQRRGGEKSLMLEILWFLCCFPSCFPLFFASWLQHIAAWTSAGILIATFPHSSNRIMVWWQHHQHLGVEKSYFFLALGTQFFHHSTWWTSKLWNGTTMYNG